MGKFIVTMTRFTEEEASFVVEADHSDVVWDVVGNMGIHYVEDRLKWKVTNSKFPQVSNVTQTHHRINVTSNELQNRFDSVLKNMEIESNA